jgi:hypothetical protein
MPSPVISKQPTSSVGPKRFFSHVAEQQHGEVAFLRDSDEGARNLAHLRGLSGRTVRHR